MERRRGRRGEEKREERRGEKRRDFNKEKEGEIERSVRAFVRTGERVRGGRRIRHK